MIINLMNTLWKYHWEKRDSLCCVYFTEMCFCEERNHLFCIHNRQNL